MTLVIAIPTFNRSKYLIQNLNNIETICKETNHLNDVLVFISDNCSTDDTVEKVKLFQRNTSLRMDTFFSNKNEGVAANQMFVFQQGVKKGNYLLFLGDDDLFSIDYFKDVFKILLKQAPVCIIPNFVPTDNTYQIRGNPREPISNEPLVSSNLACNLELSLFCHQMSGVIYKCDLFSDEYVAPMKSTIYPMIYFAYFLSDKGKFVHIRNNPILVAQNNSKDWKYDATGYSIDIISGLSYLNISNRKKSKLEKRFLRRLSWRLSFGVKHPFRFLSISNKEKRIHLSTKIFIFFALQFLAVKDIMKKILCRAK